MKNWDVVSTELIKRMLRFPKNYSGLTICETPQESYPFIAYKAALAIDTAIIYVAINEQKARQAYDILNTLLNSSHEIYYFPAWDVMPYDRISPNIQIISERLKILSELSRPSKEQSKKIIVTTVGALLTKVVPKDIIKENYLEIKTDNVLSQGEISNFLVLNSYLRVETVSDPGEFSIKGSLFDIFPLGHENPIRIDFFGDKIESIKEFDPITQITTKKLNSAITLIAANEVILNDQYIENFKQNYRSLFEVNYNDDLLYESISEKRQFIGMEHWLPLFYNKLDKLTDYVENPVIICDKLFPEAIIERYKAVEDYYNTRKNITKSKGENVYNPIPADLLYFSKSDLEELDANHDIITLSNFSQTTGYAIESNIKTIPNFFLESKKLKKSVFELLKDFLGDISTQSSKNIVITVHNHITLKKLQEILNHYELETVIQTSLPKEPNGLINLIILPLESGFIAEETILISEQDLLGTKVIRKESKRRKAEKLILEAGSLSIGEYVVHKEHGVGQFVGLKTLTVTATEHDFITIEYHGGDKLYVPVENLELITRYGSNQEIVKLDKLGSSNFQHRKAKLKKRIKDIAEDLIKIASQRETKKGQSFRVEQEFLSEFESRFKFDETNDQLSAIKDVMEDLKSGKIMDRLVCGDVGFGKTEIALRAAFIVLNSHSSKEKPQVAIIVPTTLLARQHYKNFAERFQGFDCNLKQLSRMVPAAEVKKTKAGLADGSVDIVIGTHALLSKNIKFKNLTLAIIDEEQHFGVTQKERIKELKNNVHLLTLSATPIPRTLQMSLNGIKDMSLLATPPVDRMAIRSFIMPFDKVVIRDAILREYYRGGRVFFVCPRIKDLDREAENLRKLVPEVKIIKAHGGLKSEVLDQIMNDFCDAKYDVLLSTSIVESGIDIPEANTIIIHHADRFGLSQLYQLRGRVGRSKIRAYAYFTFDAKKKLTPLADKRLEVMQTLDGLGAGFTLASYDLDIRGAGNLLGQEQSGHIKEVGAELYQALLNDAIEQLKHNNVEEEQYFSPQVNLGLSVLIPENYVSDINTKMELYRRIAHLDNEDEANNLMCEMEDRFGKIPAQVENLVEIVNLKNKCKKANIEKLDVGPKAMVITFFQNKCINPENLMNYVFANNLTTKIRPDQKLVISMSTNQDNRIKETSIALNTVTKMILEP